VPIEVCGLRYGEGSNGQARRGEIAGIDEPYEVPTPICLSPEVIARRIINYLLAPERVMSPEAE
jgi:adenylylsulfate kinase-like enzyme